MVATRDRAASHLAKLEAVQGFGFIGFIGFIRFKVYRV